jgi:hypothetical protein
LRHLLFNLDMSVSDAFFETPPEVTVPCHSKLSQSCRPRLQRPIGG